MEVHNELGNGFLEPVYQEALEEELKIQNIPYEREKLLTVVYKGKKLNKEYYADFVCYGNIIVELKAVSVLSKPHKAQVLNYFTSVQLTRKIIEKPQGGSIHLWGRFFVIAGKPILKFSMLEKYNGNF